MNIKERQQQNQQKMIEIQQQIQQLDQAKQNLLQELLRLDGEGRLLNELEKEVKDVGED